MQNKTITYSLLGIILLLFITYFTALKTISPSGQHIPKELNYIIQYAQQDEWSKAEDLANKLVKDWNNVKYFLALNYAEADYSLFLDNLSKIQGAIKTKDATETVSQALSTIKLWDNFIKIIPQP